LAREVIRNAATAGVLGFLLIGISRPLVLAVFTVSIGLLVWDSLRQSGPAAPGPPGH
jgi:hypothetical protein